MYALYRNFFIVSLLLSVFIGRIALSVVFSDQNPIKKVKISNIQKSVPMETDDDDELEKLKYEDLEMPMLFKNNFIFSSLLKAVTSRESFKALDCHLPTLEYPPK
ncbi:hypothetical protein ACJVDH_03885 [Pedobacter sp. AW1-32]|uniref:hypothetical protein n=1 Tax=Pedobacter sp. AW1-32 TaxID=3383026 RepID=UPI003FEF0913